MDDSGTDALSTPPGSAGRPSSVDEGAGSWLSGYRQPLDDSRHWYHHEVEELPLANGAREKYVQTGEPKTFPGLSP